MHPFRRQGLPKAAVGDRGAAAVEFALIVPVVILLTFGIMEFALLLRDQVAMTNLVRDASRTASTNPRVGNVPGHAGAAPTGSLCTSSTDPRLLESTSDPAACRIESFAYLAAKVVEDSSTGLPQETIKDFWVYLANREGYPSLSSNWKTDTNRTMTCTPALCVRYRWIDGTGGNPGRFQYDSGSWRPRSINACSRSVTSVMTPTTIPDGEGVGIYMRVDHNSIIPALFPGLKTLDERNVVKFEPMRFASTFIGTATDDTCRPRPYPLP